MSFDPSRVASENIALRQKLIEKEHEITLWKKNFEELGLKLKKLEEKKCYIKDLEELTELKLLIPQLQEKEFKLSAQVVLLGSENSRLHQILIKLQDEVCDLEQQIGNYKALKQQFATLQKASQKLLKEIEQLKCNPPQVVVESPEVGYMKNEIQRLNKIIVEMCKSNCQNRF